jgi:hypothetical protein
VIVAEPGRGSRGPVGRSPAEEDPLASQRRIGGKSVQTFALTATLDNATAGHLGKLVFLKLISAEMSMDFFFFKGRYDEQNTCALPYRWKCQRKLTGTNTKK